MEVYRLAFVWRATHGIAPSGFRRLVHVARSRHRSQAGFTVPVLNLLAACGLQADELS